MRTLTIVLLMLAPAAASADVPGPYDEYCDIALQERDGSHCEGCSMSVHERAAGAPDPCAALASRGLVRRCSRGGTITFAVYCDRAGDYVTVGGGTRTDDPMGGAGSCACRATRGGSGSAGGLVALAIAAALARRRR